MYCQKYFGGLGIHILPFEYLAMFFDGFFENGFRFSFQYCLSLIQVLGPILLQHNSHSELMALLRLDEKNGSAVA
eukprot:TRINITY_DN3826_c0_g1_i1.p1 TRINITY_DN3826_c0_g1~~TRINITY_DN3826_c0_g1_i1.p1  ORF type:complete len:75 (-),score=10.98 TRINITY_DN3826_c0_g1_i1:121-345(-)